MDALHQAPAPASLARGALRRLAQARLEPTPENYARAYADESGSAAADPARGTAWLALVGRLLDGASRESAAWPASRRRAALQRLLDAGAQDPSRVLPRLQTLAAAWEHEAPAAANAAAVDDAAAPDPASAWMPLVTLLAAALHAALPAGDARAAELSSRLTALEAALAAEGPGPARRAELERLVAQARRQFAHRHGLLDELGALCRELTQGLTELAEDESWAQGQVASVQARLSTGLDARGVRAAKELLAQTRQRQGQVRRERQAARDGLRQLIQSMLVEVRELGEQTGRLQTATEQHAGAIETADTLEGLAGVVQAMIADSRAMHSAVSRSQERLQADSARASDLEARVRELEAESRRLSEEVSTDALTQVANRRGLMRAFEVEVARCRRDGGTLAIGLLDIDNFKKLNDSLGHGAGDQALKTLAAAVRERLRPGDHLARFGGEEFVVLLPRTETADAQRALTRLQRGLTEALFLYEGEEVFVTFSAGVTAWRPQEPLEAALERADEALYEAKRTGKNRTCMA